MPTEKFRRHRLVCSLPILCSQLTVTYFDSIASRGLSFVSNGLLSSNPSNSAVCQFVHFNVTLLPANAPAVLPRADSPYLTNSTTQSLLDDDSPPVSEAPELASKGPSFVSNGLLSSHPSNPHVGQFVYLNVTLLPS